MIIQNQSVQGKTDFTFTVGRGDYQKAMDILTNQVKGHVSAEHVQGDPKVSKVSVVGVGMRSHVGVASKMFRTLSEEGINIQMISTSEIKISVLIDENTWSWPSARCTRHSNSTRHREFFVMH